MEINQFVTKTESTIKTLHNSRKIYLWLSNQFELKPKQFFTILETLQHGGNIGMQRMNDMLRNETLNEVLDENGFPVKIEIPFGFTINAKINFSNFKYILKNDDSINQLLPDK